MSTSRIQTAREVYRELRALDRQLSADDAPAWAEVLSVVLALGLTVRGGIHVWTVLIANEWTNGPDLDPSLAGNDVTLASPVIGLRGHRYERVARYLTFVAGLGIWYLFTPFTPGGRPLVSKILIVLTAAVCLADPIAFIVTRVRARYRHATTQQSHHENTNT